MLIELIIHLDWRVLIFKCGSARLARPLGTGSSSSSQCLRIWYMLTAVRVLTGANVFIICRL